MSNLLLLSNQLKQKATDLLEQLEIVKKLSIYGKVLMTGSYDLDLMVWP